MQSYGIQKIISLLAVLMVVKLSVKNFWPHVQVVDALSRSSRKAVQVRVSVFSGTLSKGYQWKDRHGIEKTFCRVAKSLGICEDGNYVLKANGSNID
ncbi:hypothetical protein Tco_0535892 [Tanacetum coccineum]